MKCLIVDIMHPSIISDLAQLGLEVDYCPDYSRTEVLDSIGSYEGLIVRSKVLVDKELIDAGKKLQFVARSGAGTDNIDTQALEERSIAIINAPEGNRDALAEHTMGMLLSLLNNIHNSFDQVKNLKWLREENRGEELNGKTVGILGFGNMGSAFAERLNSFGVRIIAYDKYKTELHCSYVEKVSMGELFRETDILSIHVPLSEETRGLVNEEFIGKFAKPFYLINTARGEIVSLKALKYYLEKKVIKGAILDVLENEKINQLNPEELGILKALLSSNRVLITPHIAGWSHQSYVRINKVLVEKIAKLLSQ